MIRHRHIDRICAAAILLALVLTGLLCFGEALGLRPASAAPGYACRLFDDSRVPVSYTHLFRSSNSSSTASGSAMWLSSKDSRA